MKNLSTTKTELITNIKEAIIFQATDPIGLRKTGNEATYREWLSAYRVLFTSSDWQILVEDVKAKIKTTRGTSLGNLEPDLDYLKTETNF